MRHDAWFDYQDPLADQSIDEEYYRNMVREHLTRKATSAVKVSHSHRGRRLTCCSAPSIDRWTRWP